MLHSLVAYAFVCITFYNTLCRYDKGGHFFLPSYIMRTHGSRKQQDVMKSVNAAQMQKVFEVVYVNFKSFFSLGLLEVCDSTV